MYLRYVVYVNLKTIDEITICNFFQVAYIFHIFSYSPTTWKYFLQMLSYLNLLLQIGGNDVCVSQIKKGLVKLIKSYMVIIMYRYVTARKAFLGFQRQRPKAIRIFQLSNINLYNIILRK